MRIKALSKKLNLPVAEIGRILQLNSGENTLVNLKLSEEELIKVLQSLGKTLEDLDKVEDEVEDEIIEEEVIVENTVTLNQEDKKEIVVEDVAVEDKNEKIVSEENSTVSMEKSSKIEIIDTGETTLHIVDGVITAPKVELQGLTIKGKIDLPEKKTPEVVETPKNEENISDLPKVIPVYQPKPKVKKDVKNTEEIQQKNKQKQETLAAKKALELQKLREKEAKRKAIIEEQRKAHYFENVAAKTQPVKKQNKKKSEKKSVHNPIVEPKKVVATPKKTSEAKGFWGKFKAWLNGE